jgi:putative transferase (TIGR04331 family)
MVTRALITTADERTWVEGKPVIFLGDWCKRFSRKAVWKDFDSITVPYHWDDNAKYQKNYKYLNEVYESLLVDFSIYLNNFHGKNYSSRYWRILIGPWLGVFIQVLYDRWTTLGVAVETCEINECIVLDISRDMLVPKSNSQFVHMIVEDEWNSGFYGELITRCFSKKIPIKRKVPSDLQQVNDSKSKASKKISILINIIRYALQSLAPSRNDKFFITSSYLPFFNEIKLQIKLKQFPKFWRRIELDYPKKINYATRKWKINSDEDKFVKLAKDMALLFIPTSYLENYEDLIYKIPANWPSNPRVIFTSISWYGNEVFKAWTSEKCESGSELFIGQHGGHFGMTDISFFEKHQIDISDKWISWGWKEINNPKVIAGFNFKEHNKKIVANNNGPLLLVTMTTSRYPIRMMRCTIAGQWNLYFNEMRDFVSFLNTDIQKEILVRTSGNNYHGWDEKLLWKTYFPGLNLDGHNGNIYDNMKNSRLYVSTYNATTYLESLYHNFPTIIFWNEEHWKVKKEVEHYFFILEKVGIFHKTPQSAAIKVEEIWDDIPKWWNSKEVQEARYFFCENFSKKIDHPLEHLKNILLN